MQKEGGYFPIITVETKEELEKYLKLYEGVGMYPTTHRIHENGNEEYFLR